MDPFFLEGDVFKSGVEADHASKKIALQVLKKLHSTQEMFKAYTQEKQRLVRSVFIEYSVAAVLALALLFSAAGLVRQSFRSWALNSEYKYW